MSPLGCVSYLKVRVVTRMNAGTIIPSTTTFIIISNTQIPQKFGHPEETNTCM